MNPFAIGIGIVAGVALAVGTLTLFGKLAIRKHQRSHQESKDPDCVFCHDQPIPYDIVTANSSMTYTED